MLLVFSFTLLAIVSLSSDDVLLVFLFTLRAIAYTFTLFSVFNAVLLGFDFLKSSDDNGACLFVYSCIAVMVFFSFFFICAC